MRRTLRNLKLAAPLSFLIYLFPVPEIALNGNVWGSALWWIFSFDVGGHATLAALCLAIAVHFVSYVLWFAFLSAPGLWKALFIPVGYLLATASTIQLHQCTTQVWYPDWVLAGPEQPEQGEWSRSCSIPNAYLISRPDRTGKGVEVYLTRERRRAVANVEDCQITERSEPERDEVGGQVVSWDDSFMWDAYGCGFTAPATNWRGITYSGRRFPISPSISMHDFGNSWESDHASVWLSRRGLIGRYPVGLSWRLPGGKDVSVTLPPERDLVWWALSPDNRRIAFSITNRRFRETVRDFVVVYDAATATELFRKYAPALTGTEVQFAGESRFVMTEVIDGKPAVTVYRVPSE